MPLEFRYSISRLLAMCVCVTFLCQSGCASKSGPDVLTITPDQYAAAFDAALEAARRDGLTPLLKHRRSGVIETDTNAAGSLLEPWRTDNATFGQSLENTLGYQQRRARFEFSRVGFQPEQADEVVPPIDLTQAEGELELRVLVFVERANTPGLRRDTWSRRLTTRTRTTAAEPLTRSQTGEIENISEDETLRRADFANLGNPFWTPVARDPAYERRLLKAVQQALR